MHGKILVYGTDPILLTTRRLKLEKAGYRVFATMEFLDAKLVLMNQQIDVLIVCQTLSDDERSGILETAQAMTPDVKCVIVRFDGRDVPVGDAEFVEGLEGPTTLLKAIGRILIRKALPQATASR